MKFRIDIRRKDSDHKDIYVSGWVENKLVASIWCDAVDKHPYTDINNVTRYRFDCSKNGETIAILHEED